MEGNMDEHDDDLESEVHDVAEAELNSFPDLDDELTDPLRDASVEESEELPLEEDDAEL
jgi:hypothetical protein